MRRIFYFGLLATILAFTSCDEVKEAVDDLTTDKAPAYTDNGLSISTSFQKNGVNQTTTAKFKVDKSTQHVLSDTICTSAQTIQKYTFDQIASDVYEGLKEQYDGNEERLGTSVAYDGKKTITITYSKYVGQEKPAVVVFVKMMHEQYKQTYNSMSEGSK